MKIDIKITTDSVSEAIGSLIYAGLFIFVGVYFYSRNEILCQLIIFLSFRFYIYQMIDLWVSKTIFVDENGIFIRCWGMNFRLDEKKSFLRIDNMLVLSTINAKFPTLNIYRNSSSVFGRLFKNKIKLCTVTKYNFEDSKKEAQKISDTFGIPFKDVYDLD